MFIKKFFLVGAFLISFYGYSLEIVSEKSILSEEGDLITTGWARNPIMVYNPQFIPSHLQNQKKEWEHYTIIGNDFALSLTLLNIGFTAAALVDFAHYKKNIFYTNFFYTLENIKNYTLPLDPYGKTLWERDGEYISFNFKNGIRYLDFYFKNKIVLAPLKGSIRLTQPEESIAVVRPFFEPGEFFYENKVFGMATEGELKINNEDFQYERSSSSAILDWGRGVWPKVGTWYWGYAHGNTNGINLSLNMSYGYGDDSNGTVNALLVNGKIQKLQKIKWEYDEQDIKKPWRVTSSDRRVRLVFYPQALVPVDLDILVYFAKLKKLYGVFEGEIVLDDGSIVRIKNFNGFTERLLYKW